MQEKKTKILYFVDGDQPSDQDRVSAKALGTAMFRNATLHVEGSSIEDCDFVAGCAPEDYLDRYDEVKPPEAPKTTPEPKEPKPPKAKAKEPEVVTATPAAPPPPWAPPAQ